eukprot:4872277-Amphidinium_carterae.1
MPLESPHFLISAIPRLCSGNDYHSERTINGQGKSLLGSSQVSEAIHSVLKSMSKATAHAK